MKLYQIYKRGSFCSGGFLEEFDEPLNSIFTTYEEAKNCLPENRGNRFTGFTEYYINEVEVI